MQYRSCGIALPIGVAFCPICGTATSSHSNAPQYKPPTIYGLNPYGAPLQNPHEPLNAYPIPPPPPEYAQTPSSGYPHESFTLKLTQQHARTLRRTFLGLPFYIVGTLSFGVGLTSVLSDVSSTLGDAGFFFSCIIGLIILIPLLLFRKRLYLGTQTWILLEVGMLLIGFLIFALVGGMLSGYSMFALNIGLGVTLLVYGPSAAFVAFW